MNQISIINHGVKIGFSHTDYWANKVSGVLPYEIVLESGNWDSDLPTPEIQWGKGGDKAHCVTQACNNTFETRFERLRILRRISPEALHFLERNGYFDENGKLNLNERIPSCLNGTDKDGNFLNIVAEWTRQNGIFPKGILNDDPGLPWNEYYDKSKITQEMLDLGKESLKYFDFPYEWVETSRESLMKHLKQSPLQVVLPGHDVMNFMTINSPNGINYFDTYVPHKKKTDSVLWAMKSMIVPKDESFDPDSILFDLKYLDTGKPIEKLLRALRRLGWGYGMTENWQPVYDEKVCELVLQFQKAHLPKTEWDYYWAVFYYRGRRVDPATREWINQSLKHRK